MKLNKPLPRIPYNGSVRKLVIAIDLGTTFSGCSYTVLEPGMVSEIRTVTRFPEQDQVGGDAKVPSIIYYDQSGELRAIGAEAVDPEVKERAEKEGWFFCKLFKLHLSPKETLKTHTNGIDPAFPLPPDKKIESIIADFYRYLFECTKRYIGETVPASDTTFWASVEESIVFVISHPNGWEGPQQQCLRRAAIQAGLIEDNPSDVSRLTFVTEGEACFHYCVDDAVDCVIIVDAGGGTIDISTYATPNGVTVSESTNIEEITIPESHCLGSVTVTDKAAKYLRDHFTGSPFESALGLIIEEFDTTTKLKFSTRDKPSLLKVAGFNERDVDFGIANGYLKIQPNKMEEFFMPSLEAIQTAIQEQVKAAEKEEKTVKAVFLVGGFAANEWLFQKIEEFVRGLGSGMKLCRPRSATNKATADGAVSFYIDQLVSTRLARWTYGAKCDLDYDPENPQHVARKHTAVLHHNGQLCIPGCFDTILPMGTKVHSTRLFSVSLTYDCLDKSELNQAEETIYAYRGKALEPLWFDEDPGNFMEVCRAEADMSQLVKGLRAKGKGPKSRFEANFDLEISFGLTELAANFAWSDSKKGKRKRSPASLIYESQGDITEPQDAKRHKPQ